MAELEDQGAVVLVKDAEPRQTFLQNLIPCIECAAPQPEARECAPRRDLILRPGLQQCIGKGVLRLPILIKRKEPAAVLCVKGAVELERVEQRKVGVRHLLGGLPDL